MLPHHRKSDNDSGKDDLGLFDDYLYVGRFRINPCTLAQAIFASILVLFMTKGEFCILALRRTPI